MNRVARLNPRIKVGETTDRFDGHILGVGTTSGTRVVIGNWVYSPFGRFADVMVAHPDGLRQLLAPTPAIAEYVAATYTFDEVCVVPVSVCLTRTSLTCSAGPLELSAQIGPRARWGYPLRAIPGVLVSPTLSVLMNPVARRIMPGVQTWGSAAGDRTEYYGARDLHTVTAVRGRWSGEGIAGAYLSDAGVRGAGLSGSGSSGSGMTDVAIEGSDLGTLAPVVPAPHFGFSSSPQNPSLTRVTTFIKHPRDAGGSKPS